MSMLKLHGISWGVLVYFLLFSGALSAWSGIEIGFDFANYHFYDGYAFWNHRFWIDQAPAQAWTYFNPILDAVLYFLIMHFSAYWVSFFEGMFDGLIGFFTYLLALRFFAKLQFGRVDRVLAVALGTWVAVMSPGVLSMVGSTHEDIQSSLFFILGLAYLAQGFGESRFPNRLAFWAGFFCAASVGLKLTLMPFELALIFCFLGFSGLHREFKAFIWLGLGTVMGFFLVEGWWAGLLYFRFHNPVFPYFNNIFHSPFYGNISSRDLTFAWTSWKEIFILPFALAFTSKAHVYELAVVDPRLALVLNLGAIFWIEYGLKKLKKWPSRVVFSEMTSIGFFSIFSLLAYVIWGFTFGIYRYAIPLQILSSLLIVYFGLALFGRYRRIGLILVSALVIIFTIPMAKDAVPALGKSYVSLYPLPRLPAHALVILGDRGESFVLPILRPEIALSPNLYPEDALYLSGGKVFLRFPDPQNLSLPFIEKHQGPMFLLRLIPDSARIVRRAEPGSQDKFLEETGPCQHFMSSLWWRGPLELCPVKWV